MTAPDTGQPPPGPGRPGLSARIALTRGQFAIVDLADLGLVNQFEWIATNNYGRWYCQRRGALRVSLHKFLTGYPMVDHRNGDGLDNRRANLRLATPSQNLANRTKYGSYSSIYKGVFWCRNARRWHAGIMVNGRRIYLGHFVDEIDGALAYDAAARLHFGEYATFNFPQPGERSALPARHSPEYPPPPPPNPPPPPRGTIAVPALGLLAACSLLTAGVTR